MWKNKCQFIAEFIHNFRFDLSLSNAIIYHAIIAIFLYIFGGLFSNNTLTGLVLEE